MVEVPRQSRSERYCISTGTGNAGSLQPNHYTPLHGARTRTFYGLPAHTLSLHQPAIVPLTNLFDHSITDVSDIDKNRFTDQQKHTSLSVVLFDSSVLVTRAKLYREKSFGGYI